MKSYEDIINNPHHVSKNHPRMSMHDRAAQFSSFAALTGYEGAVAETGRLTEKKRELSAAEQEELDLRFRFLSVHLKDQPKIGITYFVPDKRKAGGSYQTVSGHVKRISNSERIVFLKEGLEIRIDDIQSLTCKPFDTMEKSEGGICPLPEDNTQAFDEDFPPLEEDVMNEHLSPGMGQIRPASESDFESIYEIVNDAAQAYRGVIPVDCWHEPYMPREELRREISSGVQFFLYEATGIPLGVMGIQDKGEVNLIRHAYVRTRFRSRGIGGKLLTYLRGLSQKPFLIGTWADASWAIRFYEKNGFHLLANPTYKDVLLLRYWDIPDRQMETSVVLADKTFERTIRQK